MVGSDIKLIDFNESGLSLLIKAINSRYYPLDLSRGVAGETRVVNGKKLTHVTLDKYPLFADSHPVVTKNGRYYSFDVDTSRFTTSSVDPKPQGVIKVIAIPYKPDQTTWRFTVDGDQSAEYANLTDANGGAALLQWSQVNNRMMVVNTIPVVMNGERVEDYFFLLVSSLKPGMLRDIKIEELSGYDFNVGTDITNAASTMLNRVIPGTPNLLPEQIKLFQSGEFISPYEVSLTYYVESNGSVDPIACSGGTAKFGVRGFINESPTVPATDVIIKVWEANGDTSEISLLNSPGGTTENGLELMVDSGTEPNEIIYHVYNLRPNSRVIGLKFLPENQDYITNQSGIDNDTIELDPDDHFWKGCVKQKEGTGPTECPASSNIFNWFDINNYENLHLWYNDEDYGLFGQYLEGNTSTYQFTIEHNEGYGGTIKNNMFECSKFRLIDPSGTWDPTNIADFESYDNGVNVDLKYLPNGIEFHLAGKTVEPISVSYYYTDSRDWTITRAVGDQTVTMFVDVNGDYGFGEPAPLLLSINGTEINISDGTIPETISRTYSENVTFPTNVDPSMATLFYTPEITISEPTATVSSAAIPVLTQLLNSNFVPTIGLNEIDPYASLDKRNEDVRLWVLSDDFTIPLGSTVKLNTHPSYHGLELYIDEGGIVGNTLLGTFDDDGVIEFTAPVVTSPNGNNYERKLLYIKDATSPEYLAAWSMTFDVPKAELYYLNGDPVETFVGTVGQPFPDMDRYHMGRRRRSFGMDV